MSINNRRVLTLCQKLNPYNNLLYLRKQKDIIMKKLFKILGILILVIILGIVGLWGYLKSTGPKYSGTIDLDGITSPVIVYYDDYGIPHIYAQNAEDAYHALGYAHAQDRLFQMEMIRRLMSGRLAEILGDKLLNNDRIFLNLRLREAARKSAEKWFSNENDPVVKEAKAYLDGINDFVDHGKMPIEFRLLKIPKRHFEPVDIYTTIEYLTLGFSAGLDEEPIMSKIYQELGPAYLEGWDLGTDTLFGNVAELAQNEDLSFFSPIEALNEVGLPLWEGSNSWVLAPKRTESGKVIFANDTHIGFSQPSVWYEAHLEYPGFSFYGNYLAGVPFGVIGHTREHAWGLTIFPVDNMDLYQEKLNPENPNQVWEDDHWQDLNYAIEIIPVKGKDGMYNDTMKIPITRHGPVIKDARPYIKNEINHPISLQWTALKIETQFLHAARAFAHGKSMDDMRKAAHFVDILGLNVMYGDAKGNIAKWSAGRIPIRPDHVNSKLILDGASGKDEWLGYYDFTQNPQTENPEIGYVVSSNDAPPMVNGHFYNGYYPAQGRIGRVVKRLAEKDKWNIEALKSIQMDHQSDVHAKIAKVILGEVPEMGDNVVLKVLKGWDGVYGVGDNAPVVFTKLVYEIMEEGMKDELGEAAFNSLRSTYLFKNNYQWIIPNAHSPWWDNIHTKEKKETRKDIFAKAINRTEKELKAQLGENPADWKWGKVHTLTHIHPIGRDETMNKIFHFNVGPFPVESTDGVPDKLAFVPNGDGKYPVISGPALRILLDFADVEHSISINPTGESGSIYSSHYNDQAQMYVDGKYRLQMMNKSKIQENGKSLTIK